MIRGSEVRSAEHLSPMDVLQNWADATPWPLRGQEGRTRSRGTRTGPRYARTTSVADDAVSERRRRPPPAERTPRPREPQPRPACWI